MVVSINVLITLILISAIGVVAIPFGNPKFIGEAIIVELSFIALSVLVWQDYTKALYGCIALAIIVIIGNPVWSEWLDFDQSNITTAAIPDKSGVFKVHASMKLLYIGSTLNLTQALIEALPDPSIG